MQAIAQHNINPIDVVGVLPCILLEQCMILALPERETATSLNDEMSHRWLSTCTPSGRP